MKNLLISFSGGETSAMMTSMILKLALERYEKTVVVFANTGEENEATLQFVAECDRQFQFGTVWLEAVVHPGRVGTMYKMVNVQTAARHGEPYEAVIQKYGIPNNKFPHCTRELKERPIKALIDTLGWRKGDYHIAVGIRADEAERRSKNPGAIIYPFLDWWQVTKKDVNKFWAAQSFRLRLAGYQGNCKWCWKKSDRKLLTILDEAPEKFDFPARMEAQYGLVGPEFKKTIAPGYHRTFFRSNRSVRELQMLHDTTEWTHPDNDALDVEDGGCKESCEVNFEEV